MSVFGDNIPLSYQVLNSVGNFLTDKNLSIYRLDERKICAKAMKRTGLTDFGHPHYREGLLNLITSLQNESNLHPIGRYSAIYLITSYLVQRLKFVESLTNHPEIYQKSLNPPIIVTGLARSGTSFLHRMLAIDPRHRSLAQWELMRPFPEKDTGESNPEQRIKLMEKSIRFREPMVQGIDAIHFTRAETPEECIVALGLTFNSLIFPTLFPIPGYLNWYLKEKDDSQKFKEYRWLLQFFQSQEPERRLVLKTPAHTGNLKQIKQAIPHAMFIQTHRNPVTCVSSVCSLGYTFYQSVSDKVDKHRIGAQTMDLYENWFRRNIEFRENNPGAVYDVYYQSLVSNPIGTVKDIYAHFNLPWTMEYEEALKKFIEQNPKNKHGKHQYSASDFGLEETEISERFQFYSDYVGLTG